MGEKTSMIIFLISSISMSLLAFVYMLVMPFLEKRYCAKWRYYAWLVVIIGLLIPFRPQFDFALFRLDGQNNMPPVAFANAEAPSNPLIPINIANFDFEPVYIAQTSNFSLGQIVVVVWLLGAVIFIACQGIKHYRFIKTTRRWSKSLKDGYVLSLLEQIKAEIRIKKQIPLYVCECVGSPILIGLIKPRILLPATKLSQTELYFILKHELVHYKRKDLAYKFLVLFAMALHWFNPIVYLIARSISNLCESSCDAEVVRSMDIDMRQSYSKTIITVAKQQSKLKTALSTNFFGGKKNMKNRICHIMDTKKKKMGAIIAGLLLAVTISTGVVFAGAIGENVATSENVIVQENQPNNSLFNADALAVLEQFGVTFDGFAPFYDGGVVASERQNVYYLGQLARLFSDPNAGTWITSHAQGGSFDIHVIRNEANDITGVDITPSYSFAPTQQYDINTWAYSFLPQDNYSRFNWLDFISMEQFIIVREYLGVEGIFHQGYIVSFIYDEMADIIIIDPYAGPNVVNRMVSATQLEQALQVYDSIPFCEDITDVTRILVRMVEAHAIDYLTHIYENFGVVPSNRMYFARELTDFPVGNIAPGGVPGEYLQWPW